MPESAPSAPPTPVLPAQPIPPQPAPRQLPGAAPQIQSPSAVPPTPAEQVPASEADGTAVNVIKDTYIGGILSDYRKKEGKTDKAQEKPKPKPQPDSAPAQESPAPAPSISEGKGEDPPGAGDSPKPAPGHPKKGRKKAEPPPVDTAAIAQSVANATLQANRQFAREQKEEADAKAVQSAIPDSVKKLSPAYDELHVLFPDKYPKDLKERMAKFVAAESAKADQWEKDNPGLSYDSESEEHKDWYEKNQPDIRENDLIEARISVRAAEKAKEYISKEVEPRQQQVEAHIAQQRLDPQLRAKAASLASGIIKALDPEFNEVSEESLKSFREKDPVAYDTAVQVDEAYARVVYDAGMIWNGVQAYNPQQPGHREAIRVVDEFENILKSIPPDKVMRDGKRWLPLATYGSLRNDQRQGYFTTSYDDVVDYIRSHVAPNAAKQAYDNFMKEGASLVERLAPRLGYAKTQAGNSTQSNGTGQHQQPTPSTAVRVNSPSVAAGAPAGSSGSGSSAGESDWLNKFWSGVGVR